MTGTDRHAYGRGALRADGARAGIGFALTGTPAAILHANPVPAGILGALAVLFLAFGLRAALRRYALVEMDESGISFDPFGARSRSGASARRASLAWSDLQTMQLRFFSTRRDRSEGWMELRLSGAGRSFKIDSALDGFDRVAARAARAARANGVLLSETTESNLEALGFGGGR